jgi:hypothetical protein
VDPPRGDRLDALWQVLGTVVTGAIIVGGFAAVAGWGPAAWVLIAVVTAAVVGHVVIAILRYRQVMRRPWPTVEPLADEDDDW